MPKDSTDPVDIFRVLGKMHLVRYMLPNNIMMDTTCVDLDISVMFYARLVDRVSGEEIGRESKLVPFRIKETKQYFRH